MQKSKQSNCLNKLSKSKDYMMCHKILQTLVLK